MANRDLNNNRTFTNVVAEAPDTLVPAIAEFGQQIIKQSQEAKIVENMSAAQLEIGKLSNDFQIKYEGDPFNEQGLKDFKAQRQGILDKYGSGISPFFGRQWKDNAFKIASNNDTQVNAWGYKQARENSAYSINQGIKNNLEQALGNGSAYASGAIGEGEALMAFQQSFESLQGYGASNLGETTTAKMLDEYKSDYMLNFVSGVSESNPYKAKQILDNEKFTEGMSLIDRKRLEGHIEAKIEKLQRAARADETLKASDPAEWGNKHGLSVEQIAGMYGEGEFVDVIGNKKAKVYAETIKSQASPDRILAYADQIKAEYGGYANNALMKIAPNLPVDQASALNIAMNSDPELYAEQIKLLTDLSRYKDSELDEEYKSTVFDGAVGAVDALEEKVIETVDRHAKAMREEGNGNNALPYISQTARLAKLYRIQNPTKTVDESVVFANQYTDSKYFFAKANGAEYRIPSQLDDGTIMTPVYVNKLESRLKEYIPKIDMKVGGKDVLKKELVTPFLNPDQTGVWFRSPENTLILNSENKPAEAKFTDVLEKLTLKEKRKRVAAEIEKLPFSKRDAERKKAFEE